jgi:DNA-directed RNA polymerase subunit RPC12/RpoP
MTAKFLDSNLPAALSDNNVVAWLKTCSKLNMSGLATMCIAYIVEHQLALPSGCLATLNSQQADQLYAAQLEASVQAAVRCTALQKEAAALQKELAALQVTQALVCDLQNTLNTCAKPKKDKHNACYRCKFAIFVKPNGKDARFCINCGSEL